MMKFVILIAAVCLISTAYCKPGISGRIIGGQEAVLGQFPYAVAITTITREGHHFCSGTLINAQWVLTSGFCVYGGIQFDMVLGAIDLKQQQSPSTIILSASFSQAHPLFDPNQVRHDIGLIKFHMPIEINDYVRPIDYLALTPLTDYTAVITYGWGQINDQEPAPVDKLRHVTMVSLTMEECRKHYGSAITEEMVCVGGNNNEGTCYGDMGAPLIQFIEGNRPIHVGLASFISGHGCESTEPSGYTRTYHYAKWVRNVTGI